MFTYGCMPIALVYYIARLVQICESHRSRCITMHQSKTAIVTIILPYIEPVHDKLYNKTCMTSKDSDHPVYPPNMSRVLVYPSLDSPEDVNGTCDQRRLWSDCADAQADLSLRWSQKFHGRFCRSLAQFIFYFSFTEFFICPSTW